MATEVTDADDRDSNAHLPIPAATTTINRGVRGGGSAGRRAQQAVFISRIGRVNESW